MDVEQAINATVLSFSSARISFPQYEQGWLSSPWSFSSSTSAKYSHVRILLHFIRPVQSAAFFILRLACCFAAGAMRRSAHIAVAPPPLRVPLVGEQRATGGLQKKLPGLTTALRRSEASNTLRPPAHVDGQQRGSAPEKGPPADSNPPLADNAVLGSSFCLRTHPPWQLAAYNYCVPPYPLASVPPFSLQTQLSPRRSPPSVLSASHLPASP